MTTTNKPPIPGSVGWYALADQIAALLTNHGFIIDDLWHIHALLENINEESKAYKKERDANNSSEKVS